MAPLPPPAPAAALATRLRRHGTALLAAAAAARQDPTPANVHRLRLATRRLQGLLELAAALLGPAAVVPLQRRLRRPFRRAGRVRDLQVAAALLRSRGPGDGDATALAGILEAAVDRPLHRLRRALRRRRRDRLAAELAVIAAALGRQGNTPPARRRQATAIRRRLAALAREARMAADAAVGAPAAPAAPAALHRARLRLKRLRYALAAADGLAGLHAGPAIAPLRTVQRTLGRAADLAVLLALVGDGATVAGAGLVRALASDHAAARRDALAALAAWQDTAPMPLDTPGPDR
jgi:CHAD domain-containing protein